MAVGEFLISVEFFQVQHCWATYLSHKMDRIGADISCRRCISASPDQHKINSAEPTAVRAIRYS